MIKSILSKTENQVQKGGDSGNPKKKIWIVNFYTTPPGYSLNPRYIKIAPYLTKADYDVTIFCGAYLRRFDRSLIEGIKLSEAKIYDDIKYVHINTIRYSGNGLLRMIAIFQFTLHFLIVARKYQKPDIIYHNIHIPFDAGIYFATRPLGAKYIVEAWDLWPEFFWRMGLIGKNNLLLGISYRVERWIYSKAQKIIFTMEGGKDYLIEKKWDLANKGKIDLSKVAYINNGVDLVEFNYNKIKHSVSDDLLEDNALFRVVYVGSLRIANNIKLIIDAAKCLVSEKAIKFFIFGDGPERDPMISYCKKNNIENVFFKDKHLPFHVLPSVLSKSSLNILNYKQGFGDYGISSGKFFLYLASGKPIISNVSVKYCLIKKYKLGIAKDIRCASEYANAITAIRDMDEDSYNAMCNRVLKIASEFDYAVLAKKLIFEISSI